MDELEPPGAGSPRSPRHPNRRPTKVCARCRKRKIRCDFRIPACTPCEKAASLPCMGYDARQRKEVPRSVTAFLEARVKELEFEIQQMHLLNAPQTSADNGDSTVFAAVPV